MYIPIRTTSPAEPPDLPAAAAAPLHLREIPQQHADPHTKRQFTGNAARDTNIKIGIIVAVVLTVFIAAVGAFMYTYRESIRFTYSGRKGKGRKRRKSSGSSKSSKSAAGSDGGGPPAPPPGTPPPPDA